MARHLFVVSRSEASLYQYLIERFIDDPNVEVILDRRRGERRRRASQDLPGRRRADRRTHPEVDLELLSRSLAILTLPDNPQSGRPQ
jgi:hypothetical protein